jgi:hypothetical protein
MPAAIAITGLTAVAWHGVKVDRCDFVDVLVPLRHRRGDAGFERLHCTSVELGARYQDGPVIYTPLGRALVDAARQLTDLSYIRELVASAVQRGKILVAHLVTELVTELDAGSAAGSARMRLVFGEVAEGVRSTAEADLRTLIIQGQLPTPLYNHDLYVAGQFLARPNAWWPDAAVAAEVDSKAWHLLPADYEQTLERHDRMIAQGIRVRVLHFPPSRLRTAKREVTQQIRSTLAQSTGPLAHIETRRPR